MPLTPKQLSLLRAAEVGPNDNKLRLAFTLANEKQSVACEYTGLTASALSKIVKGTTQSVDVQLAHKLAEFFGCEIPDLFPVKSEVA